MMSENNLARPYPETIEELERKLEAKTLRLHGMQQLLDEMARENAEIREANAGMVAHIQRQDAEIERMTGELLAAQMGLTVCTGHLRDAGQHDLPPTRAEEQASRRDYSRRATDPDKAAENYRRLTEAAETDAMAGFSDTLAGMDNEERD